MDIAAFPATDMRATALLLNIVVSGLPVLALCATSRVPGPAARRWIIRMRRHPRPTLFVGPRFLAKPHARSFTVVGDEDDARSFQGAADGGQVCGIDRYSSSRRLTVASATCAALPTSTLSTVARHAPF